MVSKHTVTNWARTFSSQFRVLRPIDTVDDLAAGLEAARQQNASVRILGAAQSPSDIAMSDDLLLQIRGLNRIREIDRDRCEVVAETGISLGALAAALARQRLALPNLGSILRQSFGGAAATGTHGTGLHWGSLSTWIEGFEMLTVDGNLLHADRTTNPELWSAGRLSLGSLGVQTAFRLKVVPDFDLHVEEGPVDLAAAMDPSWYGSADHARVWYLPFVDHAWGWRAFRIPHQPRPKSRPEASRVAPRRRWYRDRLLGYHAFQAGLWLSGFIPALLPSVNRAYSSVFFKHPKHSTGGNIEKFTFDCLFHQRVSEWAVPLANAHAAVLHVRDLAERHGFPAHLPIEIRFTAGDDIPLSPTCDGPRCWIGAVSYIPWGREIAWRPWFDAFEAAMLGYSARPHWAKQFSIGPGKLRELYPRWDEFQALRATLDPNRRLRNAWTDRVLSI